MEVNLNPYLKAGSRRVCALVRCVEESQDHSGSSRKNTTKLSIFKTSVFLSYPRQSDFLGEEVASVTQQEPTLSRVVNGIKVKGELTALRASLTLEVVKQNDCLADFTCQLQSVDSNGHEASSSTKVQQSQKRTHPDSTLSTLPVLLQILDLIHQLDLKVTATSKSAEKLERKLDVLDLNLNSKISKTSEELENKLEALKDRLEDKIESSEKDFRDNLVSLQNRIEDKLGDGIEDKLAKLLGKMLVLTDTTESYKENIKNSINDRLKAIDQSLKHEQTAVLKNLSYDLFERQDNAIKTLLFSARNFTLEQRVLQSKMADIFPEALSDISTQKVNMSNSLAENFALLAQDLHDNFQLLASNVCQSNADTLSSASIAVITNLFSPRKCSQGMVTLIPNTSYPYPLIKPAKGVPPDVPHLCDVATAGGGWIIIQRRTKGTVDFYRGWQEYKTGFGQLDEDFWLGNEHIHQITRSASYELRIELIFNGKSTVIRYGIFSLAGEEHSYTLTVGDFSGKTRDSLKRHNGKKFTTFDRDNDNDKGVNCGVARSGAWWYDNCADSNLNGKWGVTDYKGPQWAGFSGGNPVSFSEMKIRRADFL